MKLNRIVSILVCGALLSPAWAAPAKKAPPTPPASTEASGAAASTAAEAPAAAPLRAPDAPPAELRTLDQEVQGLKKDVVDLNKDLFVLQEELPNGTSRIVGDADEVHLREHLRFTAIAPDDNS